MLSLEEIVLDSCGENGVTPPCDIVSFSVSKVNAFKEPADHTDPYLPTRVQRRDLARVVVWWGAWGCVRVLGGRVGDRLWTHQFISAVT